MKLETGIMIEQYRKSLRKFCTASVKESLPEEIKQINKATHALNAKAKVQEATSFNNWLVRVFKGKPSFTPTEDASWEDSKAFGKMADVRRNEEGKTEVILKPQTPSLSIEERRAYLELKVKQPVSGKKRGRKPGKKVIIRSAEEAIQPAVAVEASAV